MPTAAALALAASIFATELRVDALTNPELIAGTPSFSWKLQASQKGAKDLRQTGYRVLVATSPSLLKREVGDLWDTGKVASAASYGIVYRGKPLPPRSRVFWQVQVWDQDGAKATWTKTQSFGTGLRPQDVVAKWIHGNKPTAHPNPLGPAEWIWAQDEAGMSTPVATHEFRRDFTAVAGQSGELLITADDSMKVSLNGRQILETSGTDSWRKVQAVNLTPHLRTGSNTLIVTATNSSTSPPDCWPRSVSAAKRRS